MTYDWAVHQFVLTPDMYKQLEDDCRGLCMECGETVDGVESDAVDYECEVCSESAVFGVGYLLETGALEIVSDEQFAAAPEFCEKARASKVEL